MTTTQQYTPSLYTTLGSSSDMTGHVIHATTRNGQTRNNIPIATASNGQQIVFNTPLTKPCRHTIGETMAKVERHIKLTSIKDRMRAKLEARKASE
jgi:hypothetical protein